MTSDETDILELEAKFPAMAAIAFRTARAQALAAGMSVMGTDGGAIYEVFPDGTRRFVKEIEPPVSVPLGIKMILRE